MNATNLKNVGQHSHCIRSRCIRIAFALAASLFVAMLALSEGIAFALTAATCCLSPMASERMNKQQLVSMVVFWKDEEAQASLLAARLDKELDREIEKRGRMDVGAC